MEARPPFNPDLHEPFTEAELDKLGLDSTANGVLCAFDINLAKEALTADAGMFVTPVGPAPTPKYANLLYAAPFMFQRLGDLYKQLEVMVETAEKVNAVSVANYGEKNALASALEQHATAMQDRVLEARRCAVVGPVTLAEEVRRHLLTQPKPKG